MPPSTLKLQRTRDFEAVFTRGRGVGQDGLFLKFKPSALGRSRFGIVVSKKTAAKAVARNRKRRLLREALRFYAKDLINTVDGVLVVQPAFGAANLSQAKVVVEKLFHKALLLA